MRRLAERAFTVFSWAAALGLVLGVGTLLVVLLLRGGPQLGPRLLFGDVPPLEALRGARRVFDGIWPAVVGSLLLVLLAAAIAVPVGVAAGIHAQAFASGRFRRVFDLAVDMLAGVPSIVMGLFGFAAILLLRRTVAPDALTGLWLSALCIALLVLPYLARTTQAALQALPERLHLLGPALGLTRWQAVRSILLPASARGILSGVVLALGRAAEDTAVIMLTGAVWGAGIPRGLGDRYEALPFRIYVIGAEYRDADQLAQGFACALVLLLLTVGLLALSLRLQRGMERRWQR